MSGGDVMKPEVAVVTGDAPRSSAQDANLLHLYALAQVRWALVRLKKRVVSCPPSEWRDECVALLRDIKRLLQQNLEALRELRARTRSGAEAA
jgi:hypothetical protein